MEEKRRQNHGKIQAESIESKSAENEVFRVKERYICPFTDFGFKKLFGTEPNKDLLIDFLNELLRNDEGEIVDLTYLSSEQLGRSSADRNAVFDIYCENEKGEKFIVELQKVKQAFFKDRSIFYSSFPIQSQGEKGPWDFQLKSVYTIDILDFIFDKDDDNEVFHHDVQLVDKSTQKVFYDKLTYVYLEMPKFNKTIDELETKFDKWLYVLKNLADLTNRPKKLQEKIFNKLFEQAEIANYDDSEYSSYQESLKHYRDFTNVLNTAHKDGIEEGKAKGQLQKALQIARTSKAEGLSPEVIAKITGLTIDEIKNL